MTVEEALIKYLNNTRKDIIDEMKFRDMYLSGKTANELEIDVEDNVGQILADVAFQTLLTGRAPGKMPPIAGIQRWVEMRNLNISPWAIAKSIAKNGTAIFQKKRAPLDLNKVMDIHKQQLLKDLGEHYRAEIVNEIKTHKP